MLDALRWMFVVVLALFGVLLLGAFALLLLPILVVLLALFLA